MSRKILSFALIVLLANLISVSSVRAGSSEADHARFAQKVKAGIAKLGTGEAARVELKLRDNTKLKGYIAEAGENDFAVADSHTGIVTRVLYAQVKQIKGNNLSTGAKVAIGLGIAVGVLILLLIIQHAAGQS